MQEMDNSGDMDDLIAECGLMARQLWAEWKDVAFMEWFAARCVDEMARDIQARATPEEWDRLVAGTQQDEERQDDAPDFTTPSM